MERLEEKNLDIVRLFLEKIEEMTPKERAIIIKTIEIINHPIFISGQLITPPIKE